MATGRANIKTGLGIPFLDGSGWSADLFNLLGGFRSEQQWRDFQAEQVDPYNAAGAAGIRRLGEVPNVVRGSQQLADQADSFADKYFNPDATRATYDARMSPISGALSDLPGSVNRQTGGALDEFGDSARGIQLGLGGALSGFQGEAGAINQGYGELLGRARGLVEGISDQDRRDVNRRFDQEGAGALAGLAARGLGTSTIAPSVQGAVEGRRSDELRRLSDQRLNQMLGVESTFGAGGLNARAALAGTGLSGAIQSGATQANLAGNALSGGINAATLGANTGLDAARQRSDIVNGRFDAVNNSALNRLDVMDRFGKYPYEAGLDVAGMNLDYYGPRVLLPPAGFNPIQAAPRGGR